MSRAFLRWRVAASPLALLLSSAPVFAQPTRPERPGAVTVGAGLGGSFANTLSGHCGTAMTGVASAGARWHLRRAFAVDATTVIGESVATNDCLFGVEVLPGGRARTTTYVRDPDDGVIATAVRAGLEGGGRWVRARLLGGGGRMWRPGVSFVTGAAGVSAGPPAARLTVEWEMWRYSLPVVTRVTRMDGNRLLVESTSRRLVSERNALLRVGVDVALGGTR